MYGQTVRQQPQLVFKKPRPTVGFLGRKAVPIAVKWTSASVSEFSNVLRRVAEHSTALESIINRGNHEGIIAIIRLYPTKKHVAVNQVWRACHLGAILIETLAREALGRQIRQSLGTC